MKKSLEHFFVQLRKPDGSLKDVPEYHVSVLDIAETMKEVETIGGKYRTRVLTMAQADAEGYTLPAMIAEINAATFRANDALSTEVQRFATALDTSSKSLAATLKSLDSERVEKEVVQWALSAEKAEHAATKAVLEMATRTIAELDSEKK